MGSFQLPGAFILRQNILLWGNYLYCTNGRYWHFLDIRMFSENWEEGDGSENLDKPNNCIYALGKG